jgi:CHASE3 domain sensor protein
MAGMLPIFFLICIFLFVVIVMVMFAAISIEKKYISIIQRMEVQRSTIDLDKSEEK